MARAISRARRAKPAPAAAQPKRCLRVGAKGTPLPAPSDWDRQGWKLHQDRILRATGRAAGPFDLHILVVCETWATMLFQDAVAALQVFDDETQYRLGTDPDAPSVLFRHEAIEPLADELRAAGFTVTILEQRQRNGVVDIAAYKSRKAARWRCN